MISPRSSSHLNISTVTIFIIFFVLFSRVMIAVGAPTIIIFLHFAFLILAAIVVSSKIRNRITLTFFLANLFLLCSIGISAILNRAGFVNVVLEFLLLSEPFLLFFIMIVVQWDSKSIRSFRFWLLVFVSIHVILAYYQRWILGYYVDNVVGLFIGQGAGAHIAGAIASSAACYFYFSTNINFSKRFRFLVALFFAFVIILSDSKQVLLVLLISLVILAIISLKNWKLAFKLLVLGILSIGFVVILSKTIFSGLAVWAKVSLIQEGIRQKLSVFPIIYSFYDSFLNFFWGLGPGHTVGRLASMLPDYNSYLKSLGATTSPITNILWDVNQGHFMSNSRTGSSLFSLFFSWSGVWGDLGIIGLIAYTYLWFLIWRISAFDQLSKFLILNILIFGGIFGWLEEPQYVLFVVAILGLRLQELRQVKLYGSKPRKKESFQC